MLLNVVVVEPSQPDWTLIAKGIRHHLPDASILRVRDGEQALRFLFQRGLLTDEPEVPDLVVLASNLAPGSAMQILAHLRKDPRTRTTPVILLWRDRRRPRGGVPGVFTTTPGLFAIECTADLEAQVAAAVLRTCESHLVTADLSRPAARCGTCRVPSATSPVSGLPLPAS
jgi:CheY-like chemotaxis protein